MAISSLRYRPGAHPPEESKHGYVVFNGDPKDYHHWLFRTRLKIKTCKQDEFPRVAQNVVENLRGEALQVAIEIGIDNYPCAVGRFGLRYANREDEQAHLPNNATRVEGVVP